MTENQKQKIDNLIAELPEHDRSLYREIAEHAVSLGYLPSKTKKPIEPMVFAKNVNNCWRRLCKISPPNPAKQLEHTVFALAFYKVPGYSDMFHEGVKRECESRKSRVGINGCGGCGQCDGYNACVQSFTRRGKHSLCSLRLCGRIWNPPLR